MTQLSSNKKARRGRIFPEYPIPQKEPSGETFSRETVLDTGFITGCLTLYIVTDYQFLVLTALVPH